MSDEWYEDADQDHVNRMFDKIEEAAKQPGFFDEEPEADSVKLARLLDYLADEVEYDTNDGLNAAIMARDLFQKMRKDSAHE